MVANYSIWQVLGFCLAAYSIVANDAIQTLGTFLSSNSKRPWWVLWLFACSILTAVLLYSWYVSGGDVSYGRLEKIPEPKQFTWLHVAPPLVLLVLTRYGYPVSTTFLILTFFAPSNLGSMVLKSVLGYAVAFVFAFGAYYSVAHRAERLFAGAGPARKHWIAIQWLSTGLLWSQWLIQDLANTFVYMPRNLSALEVALGLGVMYALHAYTFYSYGGAIQKIVTNKTSTADIRSASIIDFLFAVVLLIFKEVSRIPMSTTWVFLGVLAGREIALSMSLRARADELLKGKDRMTAGKEMGSDLLKATAGLLVSTLLAVGLPWIADTFELR